MNFYWQHLIAIGLCMVLATSSFGQLIVKNNSETEVMRVDHKTSVSPSIINFLATGGIVTTGASTSSTQIDYGYVNGHNTLSGNKSNSNVLSCPTLSNGVPTKVMRCGIIRNQTTWNTTGYSLNRIGVQPCSGYDNPGVVVNYSSSNLTTTLWEKDGGPYLGTRQANTNNTGVLIAALRGESTNSCGWNVYGRASNCHTGYIKAPSYNVKVVAYCIIDALN